MEARTGKGSEIIGALVQLQGIDRMRDRLQKRLDQVPIKLRQFTDAIAALDRSLAEQEEVARHARAEADRGELEVKTYEERREKIKEAMNAPKLGAREYETLREELAGVLADINSYSDAALKSLQAAEDAGARSAEIRAEREKAQAEHQAAREKLEGSLAGVRAELSKHDAEREAFLPNVPAEALAVYERVRRKHKDALAVVDGTIDRNAGRIGNDLHCAACYMTITANDAVQVLEGKKLIQCKSCARILYVP